MRAKIAVTSTDPDVDPVGACVGVKGARVQNVVQELRGEKIDIVPWEEDETRFVCNAIAPAEVIKVRVDEDNHSMDIVVADNQLSLAIGKRGQNVKLASILTGWKLDIVSETKMSQRQDDAKELLKLIEGVNDTLAQSLYQYGFTMEQIANSDAAVIATVPGFNEEKAKDIQEKAKELLASGKHAEAKAKQLEAQKAQSVGVKKSRSAADEQLKAEMKALQEKEKTEAETRSEASKEDSSES
jgi:N utilization substance protein A